MLLVGTGEYVLYNVTVKWNGVQPYLFLTKSMNQTLGIQEMTDNRNVDDKYKGWLADLIREDVQKHTFPYAVMMENWMGDFKD